jgi:hypothetical protein
LLTSALSFAQSVTHTVVLNTDDLLRRPTTPNAVERQPLKCDSFTFECENDKTVPGVFFRWIEHKTPYSASDFASYDLEIFNSGDSAVHLTFAKRSKDAVNEDYTRHGITSTTAKPKESTIIPFAIHVLDASFDLLEWHTADLDGRTEWKNVADDLGLSEEWKFQYRWTSGGLAFHTCSVELRNLGSLKHDLIPDKNSPPKPILDGVVVMGSLSPAKEDHFTLTVPTEGTTLVPLDGGVECAYVKSVKVNETHPIRLQDFFRKTPAPIRLQDLLKNMPKDQRKQ